jgi:hypothetical protein
MKTPKWIKSIIDEIKFIYTEVKLSFSGEPSFFSSKRIERMLLFMTALTASNVWFWSHYPNLDVNEVSLYIGLHLGYAGYTMAATQKEKKFNKTIEKDESKESTDG